MAKAKNAGEFFGTLQQSIVEVWRMHLETNSYNTHVILNEFYDKMIDLVDDVIEHYIGINGKSKVKGYKNTIEGDGKKPVVYIEALRDFVNDNKDEFCKESELKSDIDSILGQIDSTLYKLSELVSESAIFGETKSMKRLNPIPSYEDYYDVTTSRFEEDDDDMAKNQEDIISLVTPTNESYCYALQIDDLNVDPYSEAYRGKDELSEETFDTEEEAREKGLKRAEEVSSLGYDVTLDILKIDKNGSFIGVDEIRHI